MPFWSGEKLEEEVENCIMGPYNSDNIDCAAYTLHVGPEVFITPDHYEPNPSKNTKRTLSEKEAFNIPSGQFAFLVTEEEIKISNECLAFISMKATAKFKGLVNVSGFHVDPGYKGRLVFSVFNAGPMLIKLQRGMPLFLMWLADLDRPTKKLKNDKSITELDLKIIDPIHGPIFSPQSISNSVKDFKDEINNKLHVENVALNKELGAHKEYVSDRFSTIEKKFYSVIGALTIIMAFGMYAMRDSVNNPMHTNSKTTNHEAIIQQFDKSKSTNPVMVEPETVEPVVVKPDTLKPKAVRSVTK